MSAENHKAIIPGKGSIIQMALSTTPILGLLCYFLYLAHKRPNLERYNLSDDADDGQIITAFADPIIAMIEMFYVFLSVATFWVWLLFYLHSFVPKRRKLVQTYLNKDVVSVLGDVSYEKYYTSSIKRYFASTTRSEYAYVTYSLEKAMCIEEELVDKNFFESWINGSKIYEAKDEEVGSYKNADECRNISGALVQKKFRTYHPFDREQITVLVHRNKPRSGIPKADIETDVNSQVGRDSIKALQRIAFFWIIFSMLGSLYIILRMRLVDDAYENDELAWKVFAIVVLLVMPLISFGLNRLNLFFYKRFLFEQGNIRPILDGKTIGGNYVQIS